MTYSDSTPRDEYNGDDSTTVFAYTYRILTNTDLKVYLVDANDVETLQTITTHYTVSNVGVAGGGNVTMVTAPASTERLIIERDVPFTQSVDLTENDEFPAETQEQAYDRLTMLAQQNERDIDRAVKHAKGTADSVSTTLPAPAASQFLAWNATADALINAAGTTESTVSTFMATVLDDTTAAAALTTLGIGSTDDVTFGSVKVSVTDTITAGTTQTQAGATAITTPIARVTVSGTDGDGVKLPAAAAGESVLVINDDAAQTIKIWPNTSDSIDGGAADAVDANALKAGSSREYIATDATNWYTAGNDVGASPTFSGDVTGQNFIPTGDTAAGDAAAIGYTATEGLILTGQGSSYDVTIKNDADGDVMRILTGTTNAEYTGQIGIGRAPTADLDVLVTDQTAAVLIESSDNSNANEAIAIDLYRSPTGVTNDELMSIHFSGKDDAGNKHSYVSLVPRIAAAGTGAEEGWLDIRATRGGSDGQLLARFQNNTAGQGQLKMGTYGTAALPAFTFSDRPTDGFFSPGAGQIGIALGGSDRFRFLEANADDPTLDWIDDASAHGLTGIAPTTTVGRLMPLTSSAGGILIYGLAESSENTGFGPQAYASGTNTTKTTSGRGVSTIWNSKTSGTSGAALSSNANAFVIVASGDAKFIVDQEGDYHYDGADGGAFDVHHDALLVSTFNEILGTRGEAPDFKRMRHMADLKLLGWVSPDRWQTGERPMVNGAQMQRLLVGNAAQAWVREQIRDSVLAMLLPGYQQMIMKLAEGRNIGGLPELLEAA